MIKKLLIANRGEIACRVIDTARRMGVSTVSVYSDADAAARHVAMADEAVRIGPAPVTESYLLGDAIIAAALRTGAQAIHPGYGFLSENPDFVDMVEAAGLIFVGPSAKAIRAMGLKGAAKALMQEAGVPVVPGYHGDRQQDDYLAGEADQIGYPVLIKAVAGGGGKGMRKVDAPADFAAALASARSEAKTAFGNSDVLIEKFVTNPRHIEVQVFGDGTQAIHLFERDCSLQRRHQKVIEEAPAPGMTEDVRSAMGAAAVRAAEAIGYKGAGTVEFIVDGSGPLRTDGFWFMEMNTRLQVEHPVTEAITGVDLVEWQLRVASGESLPAGQGEITITGHSFEARLYAEDAARGFLPATGQLEVLEFPADARIDTGVRQGDEITPHYDPMIAKITTHGPDRTAALAAMDRALSATGIAGTTTNLGFLSRLIRHEGFARGQVDTGLIDREQAALTEQAAPGPMVLAAAVLTAMGLPDAARTGFTLWQPLCHRATLQLGEDTLECSLQQPAPGQFEITAGETSVTITATRDGAHLTLTSDIRQTLFAVRSGDRITVLRDGEGYVFTRPAPGGSDEAASGDTVTAPMPGLVKSVSVSVGDPVEAGQRLMVLEAMKMEHALTSPRDGIVARVAVAEGTQVTDGALLIALEDADG
ncbi:acetyl/propionyl/methylcrotonyl-CoA carboxylase subunit alpha [Halovulum sp. GXIMD14793]